MSDRAQIMLVCEECGGTQLPDDEGREGNSSRRLALKKFCPACNRHTVHKESK